MTALVLNLATSAAYHYDPYAFRGFARHGERQFACDENGLYELVGDSDADEPIVAYLQTGKLDFGNPFLKSLAAIYLGYQAAKALTLTVTVDQQTVDYALPSATDAAITKRCKTGRGLKSRYWQLRLANTQGSDFYLETLDVLPVVLQRRV